MFSGMSDTEAMVHVETSSGVDFSVLAGADALWCHWGFEPWSLDGMAGVSRRVTCAKSALLGDVARYYAYDYIVWTHHGEADCQRVYETWRPAADVMMHRFVFVTDAVARPVRRRSFLFGLRGYLEVYAYAIGGKGSRGIRDLTPLINHGWETVQGDAGR